MSDIGVLVWDERQPRQQEAYDNFLGNAIAGHLRAQGGLAVRSAGLDDADQGLSDAALDASRVLVWWGHVRHRDVSAETGRRILDRVIAGRLSLIVLHSAHWATPFIAAMDHRTREDARRLFRGAFDLNAAPAAAEGLRRVDNVEAVLCPGDATCGTLVIRVTPEAEIFVDERSLGTATSLVVPVSAGRHRIRLETTEWRFPRALEIAAGATSEIEVDLERDGFPK